MRSATEIASQVRTGRMRAVDVVSEALDSAKASQDQLNAFTLIDSAGAMARAVGIDMLVDTGRDPGPLAGVPVALKDLIDQTGLPNTKGGSFPVEPSQKSGTVVKRLGNAGAVIIGRTGLHEFAFGFTSENHWFGPVRNPWDLNTSPGGSSGGSGASVAAGIVPISIGTDTGGSVRVPAAMCGVYGLKVTHGRVPLTGVFPLVPSLDTVGPLAATVSDLAATYLAIAGDDSADPWSQPIPVDSVDARVDPTGLRFALVRQWNAHRQSREVQAGLSRFVDALNRLGADVVEIDEPTLSEDEHAARAYGPEVIAVHGEQLASTPERFGPETRGRLNDASEGTVDDVMAAMQWRSAARATLARTFESGIDALIAPTVGGMKKIIGNDDMSVDGERVFHRTLLASFTAPINQIGAPSIAAPVAGPGTPPVSVQLIGPMWGESKLLSIATALEAAEVIGVSPPPVFFG